MGNVIMIDFTKDLGSALLNKLKDRMKGKVWREANRDARKDDNPDEWDWDAIGELDIEEYEKYL